jgi:hypothetical protein
LLATAAAAYGAIAQFAKNEEAAEYVLKIFIYSCLW